MRRDTNKYPSFRDLVGNLLRVELLQIVPTVIDTEF